MVTGPVKTLLEQMKELHCNSRVPITKQSLFDPCLDASIEELQQARLAFITLIDALWGQAEGQHRNLTSVKVLRRMAMRASHILDGISFCTGIKISAIHMAKQQSVQEITLPELPGSHCNLDGYPHVG